MHATFPTFRAYSEEEEEEEEEEDATEYSLLEHSFYTASVFIDRAGKYRYINCEGLLSTVLVPTFLPSCGTSRSILVISPPPTSLIIRVTSPLPLSLFPLPSSPGRV